MTTIDDLGFHRTRLDQRLADLVSAAQNIFGTDIDINPESPDGQLLGVIAEAFADLDSLAEAVYLGRSPAGARGAALARLVRLNGITKLPATYSTAPIVLSGVSGTLIPAGSIINSTSIPATVWQTTTDLTIGGSSTGTASGTVQANVTGPVHGPANTLTAIKTVISGWTGATNPSDAALGTDAETDAALRVRRAASVALPSLGLLDGLVGALSQLPNVANVTVQENPTDSVDGNGLPRHSIHAVVDGGDATAIAITLMTHRSLGVTMVGSVGVNVVDTQGITRTMQFDRPTDAPIYVIVNLSAVVPDATKAAMSGAIVALGSQTSGIGQAVMWSALFAPVIGLLPAGTSIVSILVGLTSVPTLQADVAIAPTSIARWDISRITVNP